VCVSVFVLCTDSERCVCPRLVYPQLISTASLQCTDVLTVSDLVEPVLSFSSDRLHHHSPLIHFTVYLCYLATITIILLLYRHLAYLLPLFGFLLIVIRGFIFSLKQKGIMVYHLPKVF